MRGSVAEVCRAATWKTQQPRISFTHTSYFLLAVKKRGVQITERLAIYVELGPRSGLAAVENRKCRPVHGSIVAVLIIANEIWGSFC